MFLEQFGNNKHHDGGLGFALEPFDLRKERVFVKHILHKQSLEALFFWNTSETPVGTILCNVEPRHIWLTPEQIVSTVARDHPQGTETVPQQCAFAIQRHSFSLHL